MYASYYGLKQEPFSIAPDPRLLFMSEQHREALAHLLYGVQGGGGFVLLTGEIGTGKTTVCRSFLEQVPEHCNLAYIFNPKLTVLELLETVCHEFGVPVQPPAQRAATVKDYLDPLNAFLLQAHAAGRNNVLVIDEAQNLEAEVLEQLAQRVIARYHLKALGEGETAQYVRHRLEVCGLERPLPFDRTALRRVHALSGGVPRRINLLCDRALLGAYANGQGVVTRAIVGQAAAEVFPRAARPPAAWPRAAFAGVVGLVAGAGLLAAVTRVSEPPTSPKPVALQQPARPSAAAEPVRVAAPVAVTTAARVPAAPPTLLRDEDQAWRELAQSWKLPLPATGEPCAALAREQVHCFTRTLSLALIRQLGRPGIVTLDANSGKPSYAILASVTDQTATLRASGTEQTVTLAALAQRWHGEFSTLWRAPEGYRGDRTVDGAGGPAVEWVATQLATVKGAEPPRGKPVLDAALKAQVRSFQLAQGLPPDGRPGPLTFMQLNRVTGVEEPRLRTEP